MNRINTNSGNNFWASKLIFSYPILKGNLSVGGEYSYNHRTDAYTFQASDYVPVKATDTEINEKSAAAFVEYGRQFGIAGSLGLLLCDVTGVIVWIIYGLCGISDIVDGWLARKLKCVTTNRILKLW